MLALEEGQKFGRYRVSRQLGSGVSGISYEAEDMMLQRAITLKLLHPWTPLPDSARRQFFRDMQSISLLTHPYQAAMLDYGEVDGQLYMTRRFFSAGSLLSNEGRTWFSPPFQLKDAFQYTHQLAQALYNIHRYGFVHGAVTLANVLVAQGPRTASNEPDFAPFQLADVGTAHFIRRFGRPRITRLPITAAPEQSRGRVTPATDQYALAVLLYIWLGKRPPFIGDPEEIEQQKRSATFPLLTTLNPQVTLEQEGILRRALSTHPDERYPSVLAFAEALQTSLMRPAVSAATPQETTHHVQAEAAPHTFVALTAQEEPASTEEEIPLPEAHTTEPLSGTFILDTETLTRLSAIAKQVPPTPEPRIEPDVPSPLPTTPEPAPLPEPAPDPTPAPDPVQPEPAPVIPPPPGPDVPQPLPNMPEVPETPRPQPAPKPAKDEASSAESATATQQPPVLGQLVISYPYQPETRAFTLENPETTLGRAGSSDILLDQDSLTSRHHALIKREAGEYAIYDRRSMHGVTINGQKIAPEMAHPLTNGDQIGIGEYTLLFYLKALPDLTPTSTEHALS